MGLFTFLYLSIKFLANSSALFFTFLGIYGFTKFQNLFNTFPKKGVCFVFCFYYRFGGGRGGVLLRRLGGGPGGVPGRRLGGGPGGGLSGLIRSGEPGIV